MTPFGRIKVKRKYWGTPPPTHYQWVPDQWAPAGRETPAPPLGRGRGRVGGHPHCPLITGTRGREAPAPLHSPLATSSFLHFSYHALFELVDRHGAEVFAGAEAYGHGTGFHFFVAHYKHVGYLLQLRVAYLGAHAVAPVVQLHAQARRLQVGRHLAG